MLVYICSSLLFYNLYNFLENNIIYNKILDNTLSDKDNKSVVSNKYIIVNKVKSYILGLMTIPSLCLLYPILYNIEVNKNIFNIMGAVYASTDMAAMIYNKKCHRSTWIHHIIVQFLYYYCYINNFDMYYGLSKLICMYCIFSISAYIVNYRLAIRTNKCYYEQMINDVAFIIYFTTSILNWIIQIYLLMIDDINIIFIEKMLFILLLLMIINDDIFLMRYLYKNMDLVNNLKKLINHIKYKRVN